MNIRISNKKNKVNKNLKILNLPLPDEIISLIENSRFRYKEGLYRVLGFLLYRSAYGYSMRVSQNKISTYLGLTRTYVSEIIGELRRLKLIFMTYGTQRRGGYYCHEPSTYTISPLLRNASPYFQSKLCYLYPFLAKISFTFFSVLGNLREAVSNKLKEIKSTLYNISPYFIKSSYKDIQERSQKGSKNGVENPARGGNPSPVKNILVKMGLPLKN